MPETAKEFLRRKRVGKSKAALAKYLQAKALTKTVAFLENPHQDGVFFYPGFAEDYLHPLKEFAHACDTFVFCDWGFAYDNRKEQTFRAWFERLKGLGLAVDGRAVIADWSAEARLDDATVQELTNMDELVARFFPKGFRKAPPQVRNLQQYLAASKPARAMCASLRVRGKYGKIHEVQALFFAAEAVNLYLKLFANRNQAPEYLCVKHWWNTINTWTQLNDWNVHLAEVLRGSKKLPKYLIGYRLQTGWPYRRTPIEEYAGWYQVVPHEHNPKMWAKTQTQIDVWRGYSWSPRHHLGP